MKQEEAMAD